MNRVYLHMKSLLREFNQYFNHTRVWCFFLLFAFLIHIYLTPLIDFSISVKYKASPWGVIFLFSALYFDLFFLLGAIYLYAKVPFLERWQMYQQIRYGKTIWGVIQVGKIICSGFAYVIITFVLSIALLIKNMKFELGWGKVWYTLAMTDASSQFNMEFPVSYDVISQNNNPIAVMGKGVLVISMVVIVIGLVMFLLSICFSRLPAVIVAIFLSLMPIIIEGLNTPMQRVFVQVIPTEWIKIYKVGFNYMDVQSLDWNSIFLRLLFYILILCICIIYRIRKMEFNWYSEE